MYYDMSGFDYGILDVVQVLHLRKRRGNYYDCPFCGETHGKLNINVEKNVFRCNRCDASGGMLKLYADLHNVTLSEANQQIREALGKVESRHAFHHISFFCQPFDQLLHSKQRDTPVTLCFDLFRF